MRSLPPSKEEDQARATWSQVEALRFICIECEMVQAAQLSVINGNTIPFGLLYKLLKPILFNRLR